MLNLAIFYLAGAVIVAGLAAVGGVAATVTWNGRELKPSRLIGCLVAGLVWPWSLARLLFPLH